MSFYVVTRPHAYTRRNFLEGRSRALLPEVREPDPPATSGP